MLDSRALALLASGVVSGLTLGGLATFLWLLPGSATVAPGAVTFALVVVAIVAGVLVGRRGVPDGTEYW